MKTIRRALDGVDAEMAFEDGRISVSAGERDAWGASYDYRVDVEGQECAKIRFQHGPRLEEGSTPGINDATLIAIVLDRIRGFQSGPYDCRENALAITHLETALMWIERRARERKYRGVFGKDAK